MSVVGAHKIEALYKSTAGLRIPKNKIRELSDIIDKKLHDLLLVAEANAKYNGRDVIWFSDLPLTKAFRESLKRFKELDEKLELDDVLEHMKTLPPMYALEVELEKKLTDIVGTLIYIMANITAEFSKDKTVSEEDHQKAKNILDLMI